jgi:hypothetical protein
VRTNQTAASLKTDTLPPDQAVIVARKGLLVRSQDVACVIASTYVDQAVKPPGQQGGEARGEDGGAGFQPGAGGGGGAGGTRRVLANRIVILECAPRDPSVLRVRSTYGKAG